MRGEVPRAERRPRRRDAVKLSIVASMRADGATVTQVAPRHHVTRSQIHGWRGEPRRTGAGFGAAAGSVRSAAGLASGRCRGGRAFGRDSGGPAARRVRAARAGRSRRCVAGAAGSRGSGGMIGPVAGMRVCLACDATDIGKAIAGLSASARGMCCAGTRPAATGGRPRLPPSASVWPGTAFGFRIRGVDADGAVVPERELRRGRVSAVFSRRDPRRVGMEACGVPRFRAGAPRARGQRVRTRARACGRLRKATGRKSRTDPRFPAEGCGRWRGDLRRRVTAASSGQGKRADPHAARHAAPAPTARRAAWRRDLGRASGATQGGRPDGDTALSGWGSTPWRCPAARRFGSARHGARPRIAGATRRNDTEPGAGVRPLSRAGRVRCRAHRGAQRVRCRSDAFRAVFGPLAD